jgi:hypothetical protein
MDSHFDYLKYDPRSFNVESQRDLTSHSHNHPDSSDSKVIYLNFYNLNFFTVTVCL